VRVIRPEVLDESTVALVRLVSDDNAIERGALLTDALQPDPDHSLSWNTPAPFAGGKVHFEPQYTIFA
jgi:hypothetical protein